MLYIQCMPTKCKFIYFFNDKCSNGNEGKNRKLTVAPLSLAAKHHAKNFPNDCFYWFVSPTSCMTSSGNVIRLRKYSILEVLWRGVEHFQFTAKSLHGLSKIQFTSERKNRGPTNKACPKVSLPVPLLPPSTPSSHPLTSSLFPSLLGPPSKPIHQALSRHTTAIYKLLARPYSIGWFEFKKFSLIFAPGVFNIYLGLMQALKM